MIYETLMLLPVLPITSSVPVHEQCKNQLTRVEYGIIAVIKNCSLKNYRISKSDGK